MSLYNTFGGNSDREVRKVTRRISNSSTGSVLKLSRFLGSSSTISLRSGSNSNLTLANGNEISVVSAITAGQTQNALIREAVGTGVDAKAIEYGVSIISLSQLGPNVVSFYSTVSSGTVLASITGVPSGSTPTISPNDGRIVIGGNEISGWTLVRGLSSVSGGTANFYLDATNALGTVLTATIAVDLTPPTITSASSTNVNENATLSHTLTADETIASWSISGTDAAQFAIAGNIITWVGNGTQDYENPLDVGANNVYDITIRATDLAGNYTDQAFQVAVNNVDDDAPIITSSANITVNENSALTHTLTANETIATWSITGGADQAQFALTGNTLTWVGNGTQDYENPLDVGANNVYNVTVQAVDLAGNPQTQAIAVTVADVQDTLVGSMPTLPNTGGASGFGYDVLITESGSNTTNATNYKAAINGATAGVTRYIAIQDGVTIDLGSTNYTNATAGTTDQTVTFTGKDVVIAPESWYAGNFTYISNPFGDGRLYSRMVDRKYTIIGWQIFSGGNVRFYGSKRTINLFPTAPGTTTFQKWEDIGVDTQGGASSYLDNYVGSGTPDFGWNEYYIGKDASHTPFDPAEKLFDFSSPAWWAADYENGGIQESGGYSISTTAGSTTITVTSKQGGLAIQPGYKLTASTSGGSAYFSQDTTILAFGTNSTTGAGNTGTYEISAPALLTGTNVGTTIAVYRGDSAHGGLGGWGDATFAKYNRFYGMPSAIGIGPVSGSSTAYSGTSAQIRYNYIHDTFDGIRCMHNNLGTTTSCVDNYLTRLYHDFTRFNWTTQGSRPRVIWERNIITMPIANGKDNGNPHGDAIQGYSGGDNNQTNPTALPGWYGQFNLIGIPDYCRGVVQNFFLQGTNNFYWLGMKMAHNLGLGVNKMVSAAQRSALIKNNIGITSDNPRPNFDINPNIANWTSSILTGRASNATENGVVVLKNNISEKTDGGTSPSYVLKEGSNIDGFGSWGTTQHSNLAAATFINLNRTITTVNDMFLALKERQAGVTSGISFQTLAEMMVATDDGETRADFIPIGGFDPNVFSTSGTAYVHGPYGTSIPIVPDASTSWEEINPYDLTTTRAMGTGSGTITAGRLLRLGGTTPSGSLTQKDFTATLNGNIPVTFTSFTKSSTNYTSADNQATAYSRFATPSPSGTFVGFVIALIGMKIDTWPSSSTRHISGDTTSSGAKGRLTISSLSAGPIIGNFFGTAASGGSSPRWDVGRDTNRYTYLISCDLTKPESDPDSVFKMVRDYTRMYLNTGNSTIWSNGGAKTFTTTDFFSTTGWGVFGTYSGGSASLDGSIQGIHISLYTNSADIPDVENVNVINGYTADRINAATAAIPGVTDNAAFKLLFQGDLNAWNSSIVGVGSSSNVLTKMAGTYA